MDGIQEKQIEKKGRFIIQDLKEEKKNYSRIRHYSFKNDSKIFLIFQSFEEEDNYNKNNNFCYIYSHKNNSWINFSDFWNFENSKKKILKSEKDLNKKLFKYRETEKEKEKEENIFYNKIIINPLKEKKFSIKNISQLNIEENEHFFFFNLLKIKKNNNILNNNVSLTKRNKIRSNSTKFYFDLINGNPLKKNNNNSLFQKKEKLNSNNKIHVISNKILQNNFTKKYFNFTDYLNFTGFKKYNQNLLKIKQSCKGEFIEKKKKKFHILKIQNCINFTLNIKW